MNLASNSPQPTLLFIPDISGFTQFVNDTEISHSQHIIEELLEILIDSNDIGLKVSEIEGDAILFYRDGKAPTAAELLAQVQKMYVRFHAHLRLYETHRICQCGACTTASGLALKFVVHFGEIGKNKIKDYSKLFGKDVIVAHRLMKNNVPHEEYALFTSQLVDACSTWVHIDQVAWSELEEGNGEYDFGPIDYCFLSLDALAEHVPEPKVEEYGLKGNLKRVLNFETMLDAPIDMAFNVISDLSIRHHWLVGLKDSDMLNSKITRSGSTHRCVIKGDESDPFIISHSFEAGEDFIAFQDTNQSQGVDTVFTLRKVSDAQTQFQVNYFIQPNLVKQMMVKLFLHKKLYAQLEASSACLNAMFAELIAEGKEHEVRIVLHPQPDAELVSV